MRRAARPAPAPGQLPARQAASGAARRGAEPIAFEYRPHVGIRDRVEVDPLAPRPDCGEQVVGRARDQHDDRAIGWLLERLQHRVRGLVPIAAQPFCLEQHQHLALALDRSPRGLGQDALAHVLFHPIRGRRRFELHDVGMDAPQHEPRPRSSSATPISIAANCALRPRPPSRADRRAGTRDRAAPRPGQGAERALVRPRWCPRQEPRDRATERRA